MNRIIVYTLLTTLLMTGCKTAEEAQEDLSQGVVLEEGVSFEKPPVLCNKCISPLRVGEYVKSTLSGSIKKGIILEFAGERLAKLCDGTTHYYVAIDWLQRVNPDRQAASDRVENANGVESKRY